jgi:hypothetical protein
MGEDDMVRMLMEINLKLKFTPDNIYNGHETEILTVHIKQIKLFGMLGNGQVGGLSSASRSGLFD